MQPRSSQGPLVGVETQTPRKEPVIITVRRKGTDLTPFGRFHSSALTNDRSGLQRAMALRIRQKEMVGGALKDWRLGARQSWDWELGRFWGSFPDNAQTSGSNPLLLLARSAVPVFRGKEFVETVLGPAQAVAVSRLKRWPLTSL